MVLCFSVHCFSCGPSNKYVVTFIYILDECWNNLLRSSQVAALLWSSSPHHFTHQTNAHIYPQTSPFPPLFSHCDFLHPHLFVHLFREYISDSRGHILVSPGYDTQQVFNGWREVSHGNLVNLQSSCLNQISFALSLAAYKVSISHNYFFLDTTKLCLTHDPKVNSIQWNLIQT